MRKVLLAAVACLLGALAAMAAPPKVVYVRCGKLIFDAEKAPMVAAVVVITDGKVTAVGKDIAVPAGAEQIDLSNYTVLPGFVDAHIHIWYWSVWAAGFGAAGGVARQQGDELCAFFRRCRRARHGHARFY